MTIMTTLIPVGIINDTPLLTDYTITFNINHTFMEKGKVVEDNQTLDIFINNVNHHNKLYFPDNLIKINKINIHLEHKNINYYYVFDVSSDDSNIMKQIDVYIKEGKDAPIICINNNISPLSVKNDRYSRYCICCFLF